MYTIENRHTASGSMTVAEATRYYGRQRTVDELVDHWWGLPANRAKTPDGIYNYMLNADKSVNFILGWDDYQGRIRIIGMTPLNLVAITTQNANIFSISVETDPLITTSDPRAYELYKALGWLHYEMEKHFNKRLRAGVHLQYWQTQCSPIDKSRVLHEAEKWRTGAYNPVVKPPVVEGAVIKYNRIHENDQPRVYRFKRNANLVNFNHKRHADMGIVLSYKQGDTISIVGKAHNQTVNSTYLMTKHSFGSADKTGQPAFTNGVNAVDLDIIVTTNPPAVEPAPVPLPVPTPPPVPVKPTILYGKLDKPRYFRPKVDQVTLWDFNFEKHTQMVPAGYLKKDAAEPIRVVAIATHPTGSRYYMTGFSYDNSGQAPVPYKTTGINTVDMQEVEAPTEPIPIQPPVIPVTPTPLPPSDNSQIDKSIVKAFLESIIKLIQDFLGKLK